MNKRKLLTLALSLCMVAILAIGGTMAYFTDTEQITNTMVIGDVEINIDEWQYGENGWEDYEDETFVLYPLENDQGIKLYNKSVRTYNTSTETASDSEGDAYIRSIILVEKNDVLPANYVNEGGANDCFPGIHIAYDTPNATDTKEVYTSSKDGSTQVRAKEAGKLTETVNIGGNEYWVIWFVAVNEEAIPVDAALSSLHSVYMDKNIKQEHLSGWGDDGVQVIAFSQGIQAEGLTHAEAMTALGEVTKAHVESWIGTDDAVINDMN